jgi:hypothetical protein
MNARLERVLVTVKTYPHPSQKYDETVCTAGLALGLGRFIRLYPVRFRHLPYAQQFRKWDVIEAEIEPRTADARGDTYTPRPESIRVVDHIDTTTGGHRDWAERNGIVLPHVSTIEDLVRRAKERGGSLGLVRAEPGATLVAQADDGAWTDRQRSLLAQQKLFGSDLRPLEKVPWTFHYRFKCSPECPDHMFMLLDWETFALYRQQVKKKDPVEAAQDVLRKYNEEFSTERCALHFFVGTSIDHQFQFSIIGVYHPPRTPAPAEPPPSLFDEIGPP